jgi:hypothetical protein
MEGIMWLRRVLTTGLAGLLLAFGGIACGDGAGEDTVGDEEVNDEDD